MTREGIDIVMAMDVSASMLSKDFRPNRLEAAKKVAREFVEDRPYDRVGVVVYEGESFTFFNAIFNGADSYITIGVILLFLFNKQAFPKEEEKKS